MSAAGLDLSAYLKRAHLPSPAIDGVVTQVLGMLIEGTAHGAAVGDLYTVVGRNRVLRAEVVALRGMHALLLPLGHLAGLEVGSRMVREGDGAQVAVGDALLGRVIDGLGQPLDGRSAPQLSGQAPLHRRPLSMLQRLPIRRRMATGVRALDALVPLGEGQRLGIFAGPGVGKSVLLGNLARDSDCDVTVLALVGERGREVGHFIDDVLGSRGLARSVVVAATSDRPASERVRAAFVATAIAESFRAQGRRVLLFVDSLTRFCMAQREIGLATGEPPTTKGYPPSAFAMLPQLLERVAPAREGGAITGLYTVLVEGDDLQDPVADSTRALLDGHIILSRTLALRGHWPAIDVLHSLSRLEPDLLDEKERLQARQLRQWMSLAEEAKDLLAVGAYRAGADPDLDMALQKMPHIRTFLRQEMGETSPLMETSARLARLTAPPAAAS